MPSTKHDCCAHICSENFAIQGPEGVVPARLTTCCWCGPQRVQYGVPNEAVGKAITKGHGSFVTTAALAQAPQQPSLAPSLLLPDDGVRRIGRG